MDLLCILKDILCSAKKLFNLNYSFYLQVWTSLDKVVVVEVAYIVSAFALDRVGCKAAYTLNHFYQGFYH